MSRQRGRRYEETRKLNIKKVIAFILAIIVIIMVIVSLVNLLKKKPKTKEVSTLTTYISIFKDNKWGVIDNKGNVVIEPKYQEMIIIPNKNKDIFICTYDVNFENDQYKTKVIDADEKEILTEYNHIEPIENSDGTEIWYESNCLKYQKEDKYGMINLEGKEILAPEYDDIYAIEGTKNSIIIEKNGLKGLFSNATGEIIINPEYAYIDSLTNSSENGYIVQNTDNKYGVIGLDKKIVLETKYDEIKKVTNNTYYVVQENNNLEVISSDGAVVLGTGFDSVESINTDNIIIMKDGKYAAVSLTGDSIIPAEYEDLEYAFSNYYVAKKGGKYGIISTSNEVIVDFKYHKMDYIKEAGFIQAENEDYTTDIYDSTINKVLEAVIIAELNIDNGYLRVYKNSEYQYYNFKFEPKSNQEVLLTNTLFLFKENGKYGYKNKNGEVIVDPIYDDAKEQNEFGYCAIKSGDSWGVLKSDGTIIVSPSINLEDYLYIDFIADWYRYNDLSLYVYTK